MLKPATINTRHVPTSYRPQILTNPGRVKATAANGEEISVAWDRGLSIEQNHGLAARALCEKLGWHGTFCGTEQPCGSRFVFERNDNRHPTPADIADFTC
jgi:hypothetical protein